MGVRNVSNSKSNLQGHSRVLATVPFDGHIRFPISVLLQLYLFLAPLTRYYHLFPKF